MEYRFYLRQARRCFRRGQEYVQQGDLQQASEKLWGSSASAVKACAAKRGWVQNGHRQLFDVVDRLSGATSNQELIELFHVANSLHVSFYEGWMRPRHLGVGKEKIKKQLQEVEALIRRTRKPTPAR